jgi:hypothetical protein
MKKSITVLFGAVLLYTSALARETPQRNPSATTAKPLTYENVTSFFKHAGLRATEVQKRCTVFFEGEFKNANVYAYCLIIVENSDEDLQVTFYLTDAHEMNWVTEFLDAPFFATSETARLFELMNSKHDVRGQNVGRFPVDFHHWSPRHAQILVFSFGRTKERG